MVAVLGASSTAVASVSLEGGGSLVNLSGVRMYGAQGTVSTHTNHLTTHFIRVAYEFSTNWRVGVSHSRFGGLRFNAESPTPDIFLEHPGDPIAQVVTPFSGTESITEVAVDVCYSWPFASPWTLDLGPTLGTFHSKAQIAGRRFSGTEVKVGVGAALRYQIEERWSLLLGYRRSAPTDRSLNQLLATVAVRF